MNSENIDTSLPDNFANLPRWKQRESLGKEPGLIEQPESNESDVLKEKGKEWYSNMLPEDRSSFWNESEIAESFPEVASDKTPEILTGKLPPRRGFQALTENSEAIVTEKPPEPPKALKTSPSPIYEVTEETPETRTPETNNLEDLITDPSMLEFEAQEGDGSQEVLKKALEK